MQRMMACPQLSHRSSKLPHRLQSMAIADDLRRRKKIHNVPKIFCLANYQMAFARAGGHSMCIVINKLDRVLWIFEPLISQRIRKLNQLYPNCVKQYYQNQLSRLGYSVNWINGDQRDDEKTCYLLVIAFIKLVKQIL